MTEALSVGDRVVVTRHDVAVHTRAPRYVRGRIGTVMEAHGEHPLPDAVVAGERPPRRGTVWAVEFAAADLFGAGAHTVVADLWEQYLRPAWETGR